MRSIRISIAYTTFILLMFGIVMVYSSSAVYASQNFGDELYYLKKHLLYLMVGAVACLYVMSLDMERIRAYSKHILLISISLLVLVLVPGVGREAGGARRWIDLKIFNIQPSEVAKIAILIFMADFVDRRKDRIPDFFNGFLPPLFVIGLTMGLIVLEPDLGTTITIGIIGIILLYISGARIQHLLLIFLSAMPFLYYLVFSVPYRRKRMLAFLNPWGDARGSGFQIVQSLIALGSGGLLGVGLGQSKQKLFFLPAAHTDFILSIIGEELGFVGIMCVLILFGVILWQGARAAFMVDDTFKRTLIFGIIFTIAFEVIINAGVTAGVFPTKGLPLPFISFGGTSLVMHMLAIGLLLNATRE